MLRMLVLALLLANAVYFAWGQGLLAAYGWVPARNAEPERLAQQIRPDAVQLAVSGKPAPQPKAPQPLPEAAAPEKAPEKPPEPVAEPVATPVATATPPKPPAAQCLQVGVFTEQQASALRPRLQAGLPAGSWSFESSGNSVRWIIYMGKYINKEAMNRKRLKLEQIGLSFEPPVSPLLNPGLSLGSFGSKAEAEQALEQMNQRGIRSAKVVIERPELPSLWLRVPVADAALQARLEALKPQFAGKAMQACS